MSVIRIASRYAKSLMDLAIEQGSIDKVLGDMTSLKNAAENRDLYLMLKSPIINASKKGQVFDKLFGDKFDKMTMGFMKIVLNKGRESYLPEIANEFLEQYKKYKHISTATITSAKPLSDAAIDKLKAKLLASNVTDENVEIETVVDPSIIGGLIIEVGDKLYDASVAHKLELMRKEFTGNLYKKNF